MQQKSSNQIHTKGFYFFLSAQFLSALADNALLFAAIAMLTKLDAPTWHQPLLLQFFVFAYIVLAPFVGAFADAKPKKQVMFISNGIKFIGCIAMFLGMAPLYAYAIVGIGAAAYSPAKYGILTEILPTNLLVAANGWVEGSTVAAIILGAMFGGVIAVYDVDLAIITISILYLIAAIFNKYMPDVPINHKLKKNDPWSLVKDFLNSYKKLWVDPLGQLSLTITTLFWGAGATLRLVIIAWAAYALGYGLDKSTTLSATVALGVAIGAVIAAFLIKMKDSTKILPIGIIMGSLVCSMVFVTTWQSAAIILVLIGILSGLLIVPLNALLQHRGHLLIGAGHSIAVQNFNENLGILILSGTYTLMVKGNIPINGIMFIFGFFVLLSMTVASIYYSKTK
ncbi:lysophospholipid transporter LplT [Methylophilaceae bacterium]|nr:lysophospholipid transporter LplT [Methylophilaceae bacterium]|tara:strand:+ start:2317 stop:3504 length:1188 start_codon:yes stop_codon:yes gene_type:complete